MNSVLVQVIGHMVDSVTVRDLLSVALSPSSTYIIKTDIEDFDCEVLLNITISLIYFTFYFLAGY